MLPNTKLIIPIFSSSYIKHNMKLITYLLVKIY